MNTFIPRENKTRQPTYRNQEGKKGKIQEQFKITQVPKMCKTAFQKNIK